MKILHSKVIGEGAPLIILHGFLGMGDNWKTLAKLFSKQGYQVHLVDQRNHGRSFHDAEFSYAVMAQDLLQYCDTNSLDQITLLGHSMGGKTAMEFATTYPDRVSKLIVADIGPKAYPAHYQDIIKGLSMLYNAELKSRAQADEMLSGFVKEQGTRLFLLKNLYWKDKITLGLRINFPVLAANIKEVGKTLKEQAFFDGTTLFIRGEHSGYIEDIDQILIKKHFPEYNLLTVSNAGHWLHAENPEEFYQIVIDFL